MARVDRIDVAGRVEARPIRSPARTHSAMLATAGVCALAAAYALLFGWLSLSRYWAYDMHALDMGNMGQAAWNTLHGHPFYFTNMRLPYSIEAWRTTTRLSFHVEAIFPLISLVYLAYPHAESLLILQTVGLASGGIAVFLLGRRLLNSPWLALLFAAAYFLFPTLEALNLYEFHPVALAVPLLLFAFYFMESGAKVPFLLCSLAAMGCKEEIGLVAALLGLYAAFVRRERRLGLGLAAVGVVWSLTATLLIEHLFRQPGAVTYFRSRYGYLGHGVSGALTTVLNHPGTVTGVIFTWPKLGYALRLLASTGFVALLAPAALVIGAPTFLLNILSTDYHMYSGVGDNSAELVPVILVAAMLGTRTLARLLESWMPRTTALLIAAAWVLALAVWNQTQYGFTPIGAMYQVPTRTAHDGVADRFVSMIPDGVPVSTQDQLDPHLSSRHYLYLFEDTGRVPPLVPADYILLDVSAPTYPLPSYQIHDRAMAWIHRRGWGVRDADDGLILIERGVPSRHIPKRFYSYAAAGADRGAHTLHVSRNGLSVIGYDRVRREVSNFQVPVLRYTFYLAAGHALRRDYQPVLYEVMGRTLIGCASEPLGLAWLPTTHWAAHRTYSVRMDDLIADSQTPGTARVLMELRPVTPRKGGVHPTCTRLWQGHGHVVDVGSVNVGF